MAATFAAVAPLIGFVLALAALGDCRNPPPCRKGMAVAAVSLVLSGLCLLALIVPAVTLTSEKARRTSCMSNLKQIGLAMRMYSGDHNDQFPSRLAELAPYHEVSPYEDSDKPAAFGGRTSRPARNWHGGLP